MSALKSNVKACETVDLISELDHLRSMLRSQAQDGAKRDALHQAILESSTDYAIISMDVDGQITSWNEGARRIMQWTEEEMCGRRAHVFFTEDEVANRIPEYEMQQALANGRGEDERWHQRKDGSCFWANGLMMPLRAEGRHIGFLKILRDRTEQRRFEEQRQLMMEEMNHRVKNTLSVVQSVVTQTLRTSASPEAAKGAIMQRLSTLGRAQDMLIQTSWSGAPVNEIVEGALAPMISVGDRLMLDGPEVQLGSRALLSLNLALHELGTNAAKYGALSVETGRVEVNWRIDGEQFRLSWRESGGPPVTLPKRRGFGSRLIETGLTQGLESETELCFGSDGVSWTVSAPLAALQV